MKTSGFLAICKLRLLDIHALRVRYISLCEIRYDINPLRPAGHIECKAHIESHWDISKIPQGIYIAAKAKLLLYASIVEIVSVVSSRTSRRTLTVSRFVKIETLLSVARVLIS